MQPLTASVRKSESPIDTASRRTDVDLDPAALELLRREETPRDPLCSRRHSSHLVRGGRVRAELAGGQKGSSSPTPSLQYRQPAESASRLGDRGEQLALAWRESAGFTRTSRRGGASGKPAGAVRGGARGVRRACWRGRRAGLRHRPSCGPGSAASWGVGRRVRSSDVWRRSCCERKSRGGRSAACAQGTYGG